MTTMAIRAIVLDASNTCIFDQITEINAAGLVKVAAERELFVKERGIKFAQDGFPALADGLVEALRQNQPARELSSKAMSLAMMAWLYDNLFCNVTFAEFSSTTLQFTIFANGAVMYQRISGVMDRAANDPS